MKKSLINQNGISGILVALIIAVILIGAAGAYFAMRHKSVVPSVSLSGSSAISQKTEPPTQAPINNLSATIQDIVGRAQSLECDWHVPTESTNNPFGTGKLYTSGNEGRSMISGNSSGMSIDANAIYKGGTAYSWVTVGGTTMGFKFDKAKIDEMSSSMTPQQMQQAQQIRAKMIFNCKPWVPDQSKFVLPTGVEFK